MQILDLRAIHAEQIFLSRANTKQSFVIALLTFGVANKSKICTPLGKAKWCNASICKRRFALAEGHSPCPSSPKVTQGQGDQSRALFAIPFTSSSSPCQTSAPFVLMHHLRWSITVGDASSFCAKGARSITCKASLCIASGEVMHYLWWSIRNKAKLYNCPDVLERRLNRSDTKQRKVYLWLRPSLSVNLRLVRHSLMHQGETLIDHLQIEDLLVMHHPSLANLRFASDRSAFRLMHYCFCDKVTFNLFTRA